MHRRPAHKGSAEMVRLEQAATGQGIHVLIAGVSGSNLGAMAFCRALGFEIGGRMPAVGYRSGLYLDLVLMKKRLPGPDGTPDSQARRG